MVFPAISTPTSISTLPCLQRSKFKRHLEATKILTFSIQDSNSKPTSSVHQMAYRDGRKMCEFFDLHDQLVPYEEAWLWQKDTVKQKDAIVQSGDDCPDTLIVLQHRPVYTMGTGSSAEYLNFDAKNAPFDVYRTERGGEVTYHGPGQLVMYPVINLRNHKMDLHWYLRSLEEVVIRALASAFSIKTSRLEGFTGVWAGDQKLAAIGIRVSHWIAYHGLALNVTTDLTPFQWIIPCGIRDRQVGSVKGLLGENWPFRDFGVDDPLGSHDNLLIDIAYKYLIEEFSEVFQLDLYRSDYVSGLWQTDSVNLTNGDV